jgi:hypothetical protein
MPYLDVQRLFVEDGVVSQADIVAAVALQKV